MLSLITSITQEALFKGLNKRIVEHIGADRLAKAILANYVFDDALYLIEIDENIELSETDKRILYAWVDDFYSYHFPLISFLTGLLELKPEAGLLGSYLLTDVRFNHDDEYILLTIECVGSSEYGGPPELRG